MTVNGKESEKSHSDSTGGQDGSVSHSDVALDTEHGALGPDEEVKSHDSLDLERTTSNALSRITSRVTSRHIVDPGPPPGELFVSTFG